MPAAKEPVLLEASDVSIATATVAVKVIQVDKRQMTLSVFRQIPEAELFEEDSLDMLGEPWGFINYHWGDQDRKARHILFQGEACLYRSLVRLRPSSEFEMSRTWKPGRDGGYRPPEPPAGYLCIVERLRTLAKGFYLLDVLDGEAPTRSDHSIYYRGKFREAVSYRAGGIVFSVPMVSNPFLSEFAKGEARGLLDREIPSPRDGEIDRDFLNDLTRIARDDVADYCRRWDDLMASLEAVEQLFIAV